MAATVWERRRAWPWPMPSIDRKEVPALGGSADNGSSDGDADGNANAYHGSAGRHRHPGRGAPPREGIRPGSRDGVHSRETGKQTRDKRKKQKLATTCAYT
jgi:hypothetical protein